MPAAASSNAAAVASTPLSSNNWNDWSGCCMNSSTLQSHSVLPELAALVPALRLHERSGVVSTAVGLTIEVTGLSCAIGEQVLVDTVAAGGRVLCQVVGFRANQVILMPFGDPSGISVGGRAVAT